MIMANGSPEEIRKLEAELREVLQQGDFALALDIVEELEGKTDLKAQHFAVKGMCLIKLRRKQDAKGILLQAFELDPGCSQATQLLDENFPGWTKARQPIKQPPAAQPRPQAPMQGQPMPQQYAQQPMPQDISGYNQSQGGFALAPDQGYAPQPGYAQQQPAAYQQQTAGGGSQPNLGRIQQQVIVQATQGPAMYQTHQAEMVVNWRYILEDLKSAPAASPIAKHDDRVIPV